ncbi:MAG: hypothetical protein II623_06695 [Paludibacteraceae bacterium]|nr:hypothetical protein [Paludibacteraceae bacterium]
MKKIFRLSAMVAMVSMMATSVCVSSCSDDDDDDDSTEIVNKDKTETFTLQVGGTNSKNYGSFISIQNKKVYKMSELDENSGVEIVFNGKQFVSAASADNPLVSSTGLKADLTTVVADQEFEFTTNGAEKGGKSYSGTIKVTKGTMGSSDAEITITVTRK